MEKFKCPECGEEVTEVNSIRTYIKTVNIYNDGCVTSNNSPLQYVSTDDYASIWCHAIISDSIKEC